LNSFETLKRKQLESENDFSASSRWFDRFKKRSGIHSFRVRVEIASAEEKTAASFPGELQQITEE
jgi:hypothetical protein